MWELKPTGTTRSELQPLGEPFQGVVKTPSVEAPPSVGALSVLRLPAGGPEVELSLTAWAQLSSQEQVPRCSPRACPAPGAPPGIVILPSPNIRRCSPLAVPFTIHSPPAQAQHRRSRCYKIQVCAARCIINLPLKLSFHSQKLCLEQYDKHRQGNYLQNLCELCLC